MFFSIFNKIILIMHFFFGFLAEVGKTLILLTVKIKSFVITKIKMFNDNKKITKSTFIPQYTQASKAKTSQNTLVGCLMFLVGIIFSLIFFVIPSNLFIWFRSLPSPDLLSDQATPTPTKIYDRKGRLLYEIFLDKKSDPVKLDKIPKYLKNATISVEDDQFYRHPGFHLPSMIRAARSTLMAKNIQ